MRSTLGVLLTICFLTTGPGQRCQAFVQGAPGPQKPASSPAGAEKPKPQAPPKKDDGKGKLVQVDGEWYTPEEKEKLDAGWRRLDLDWIAPAETSNIDKGLFKINDAWVSAAEADKYYSKEERPWNIPTRHFLVVGPIPRAQLLEIGKEAESTYDTLTKLLGAEPKLAPRTRLKLRVFGSIDAGNAYGAEFAEDMAHHTSVFAAYVADKDPEKPAVIIFDGEVGKTYGFSLFYARHAAAHKILDELVPDVNKAPEWFIEGLAGYCDRYTTPQSRTWAIENLVRRGGVPTKLGNFAKRFGLSADDAMNSQTRIHEAALIVAYYASNPEKDDAARFKKAIASLSKTRDREAAIEALLERGDDLEKRLKKYAGL
jgi:hypothetical protein